MRQVLPMPYEVNPIIKLCRWSLLVAGVVYGFRRKNQLAVIEHEFQIKETKRKAEIAKILAKEKAIANAAELVELERIFLSNDSSKQNSAVE